MERTDQTVNCLEAQAGYCSFVGIGEKVCAALCEKLSRKKNPGIGTERGKRGAGQKEGRGRCARNGAPVIARGKRHGKQYPELRFVGETSDEHAREDGPALEEV